MKIIIVSGARPQFIKLAPVIKELIVKNIDFQHVHTGQHYDDNLSKQIFADLSIPSPDYNLNVGSHSHSKQTGLMLKKLQPIILEENPDLIIVPGDTNSTLAGALVGSKLNIPVVHLEAGLRSNDWAMPEEINRMMVDRVSSSFIVTTDKALNNLLFERYDRDKIIKTGDTMVDTIMYAKSKALELNINFPQKFLIMTLHRQENVDNKEKLLKVLDILKEIPITVLLPLHPRTKANLIKFHLLPDFQQVDHLILKEPLGYLEFVAHMSNSVGVLTDSGGIQKEAFILKKPCITLRTTTEWTESIKLGANRLLGLNKNEIISAVKDIEHGRFTVDASHPYGDGNSASTIVSELMRLYDDGLVQKFPNIDYPIE